MAAPLDRAGYLPCPYHVAGHYCRAGAAGHRGPHDWPAEREELPADGSDAELTDSEWWARFGKV